MTDPRWQKAMERLGLFDPDWVVENSANQWAYPDPDDPATFLWVVEALRKAGCRVDIDTYHVFLTTPKTLETRYQIDSSVKKALYEAVMETLGAE